MILPEEIYRSSKYLIQNPTWDAEDAGWKAEFVKKIINDHCIYPKSICDIGCGAGDVLSLLRSAYPASDLFGFDIAPDAKKFWYSKDKAGIEFFCGDFFESNKRRYDIILLLDVIEHIPDPFSFLTGLHGLADHYIFHIPLDLSALSVARESPILHSREKVGHINYFTKNIALKFLSDCNFQVVHWFYSGAGLNSPKSTWKTKLAALPRLFLYLMNKEMGVRLLGGETIFVLARSDAPALTKS